ncbi:MAG TPA: DUF4038 domain-containing protein [Candidatus Hydrogenedentes bacterium]|nr:DUF4038 domain-containing protein [Candidatus Hydrogenedentota bacterium]HPG67313.1 DUF4038 domain-containing protein [Candidatus Hydrogenedentota bacterium]
MNLTAQQNTVIEIPFMAAALHEDPYNGVDVDVIARWPDGHTVRIPAFWAGDNVWKFRFSAHTVGEYTFESEANVTDSGLRGVKGAITVTPYEGGNPLLQHGRLRVASDKRHFEHADGIPFFWLGDTWWMGLSMRMDWPQGFRALALDRVQKGFNVVQIIAGPYPDMDELDPRGRNEAGFPLTDGFAGINPAYYDHADLKIGHLVHAGLVPCIVGMWGYYLPRLGVDRAKRFWRYIVARYGAYPVVWCICGEGVMPYYLSKTPDDDRAFQKRGWSEVMAYVREVDGYRNLISIHPTQYGRDQVEDPALMDFEMLQTGHGDLDSVPTVIESVRKAVARQPSMPVVNSEVNYEGILGRAWQNVQRLCFYHTVMNGAAGFTYGANGIWQASTVEQPYGPSPHGRCWGNTPWQEAAQLPGARQLGLGAGLLRALPWWGLDRHPEWLGTTEETSKPYAVVAAGIPGEFRLVYVPMCWDPPAIRELEPKRPYRAVYFDPCSGARTDLGEVVADAEGTWRPPIPPECHDWVIVLRS